MRYVKICPRCGWANDELNEACEKDGEFLGMVAASPYTSESARPAPASPARSVAPTPSAPAPPIPQNVTMRLPNAPHTMYLELGEADLCLAVQDGQILGQDHPTSPAHARIPPDVPGANFVHRSHASFECRDGQWYVTAIPQPSFTNPTFVNQTPLAPGQRAAIRNGDRLVLGNLTLHVRIIE